MTKSDANVCGVNRILTPLLPRAALILFAAVILPRMLLFFYLGGELPSPPRDQPLYIRIAGRLADGEGFSFSADPGLLKNLYTTLEDDGPLWTSRSDYVFGLAPVETPTAVMEPGYPVLLGTFFRLFGATSGAVFSLNLLLALIGAFAARKLIMDVWGAQAGLMAALFWALYPPYIYYTAFAMGETAHFTMLMLSTLTILSAGRGDSRGFLAGISIGVFFLIRATAFFLIPLQLLYLIWRKRWKALVYYSAGFLIAVSPWVVRNWISLGEPVLMPTKGALNLLSRNDPEILAVEGVNVPEDIIINNPDLLQYPSIDSIPGELARNRALSEAGRKFVLSNPELMFWLMKNRAAGFLAPGGSTLGSRGLLAGLIIYPIMLYGFIGLWRNRYHPESVFLFALFVLYLLVHILAHGGVRYRLPVDSVFLLGAAMGTWGTCCGGRK